jgi:DNA-binding response OmpR family regulator
MIKAVVKTAPSIVTAFPPAPGLSPTDRLARAYRPLAPTSRLVLVIDGSPTIQKITELTLRREGYKVRCFRDGIDAMRWFAGAPAHIPDLMLVDLDLPKLDGYRVIQKFKAKPRFAHTACLVLCERDLPSQAHLEQMGVAGSLRKPFTIQELVTAVQSSIANSLSILA